MEKNNSKDDYIVRNSWYVTASKMKCYMKSKEAYKKVFIDEVDTSFVKLSPALAKGTMVDEYLLSPDLFEKHYAILDWIRKADLERQCLERSIPVEKSDKVDDLKAKLVGNKIVLTGSEVEMLAWMKKELSRQPLYDINWNYKTQEELVVEYKGLKLKWTLDRIDYEKWLIRDLKTSKDVEYSQYYWMTKMEQNLSNFDEYQ